jgi:hypothetical protein
MEFLTVFAIFGTHAGLDTVFVKKMASNPRGELFFGQQRFSILAMTINVSMVTAVLLLEIKLRRQIM